MLVEPVDLTQGLLQQKGWNQFQVDEKGAKALEDKQIPKDVDESINKAILGLEKVYKGCQATLQASAAVCKYQSRPLSTPAF